jgi:hypothetical protein
MREADPLMNGSPQFGLFRGIGSSNATMGCLVLWETAKLHGAHSRACVQSHINEKPLNPKLANPI